MGSLQISRWSFKRPLSGFSAIFEDQLPSLNIKWFDKECSKEYSQRELNTRTTNFSNVWFGIIGCKAKFDLRCIFYWFRKSVKNHIRKYRLQDVQDVSKKRNLFYLEYLKNGLVKLIVLLVCYSLLPYNSIEPNFWFIWQLWPKIWRLELGPLK